MKQSKQIIENIKKFIIIKNWYAERMVPIRKTECAAYLGVNPSTVSRIVASGKTIKLGKYEYPLSFFFSARHIHPHVFNKWIKKVIKKEDPSDPISDKRLLETFNIEFPEIKLKLRTFTVNRQRAGIGSRKERLKTKLKNRISKTIESGEPKDLPTGQELIELIKKEYPKTKVNEYEIEQIQERAGIKGIAKVFLFKDLELDDLAELANLLYELKVNKGDAIFLKGSEGDALYIILEGAVKIVLSSSRRDERIVNIFSKGDFFGEMALLDGKPRSADAVAIKPSKLLFLKRKDFMRFLKKSDAAVEKILLALSMRLRKTDELLEDLSFLNIPARLAKKLLEIGKAFGRMEGETLTINHKLTQKDLADMVGSTRESINKELRVLQEKGLISITNSIISIHDTRRLKLRIRE